MNQETNNRFEQALKDISKPEQHIREHVIIVSASRFPRLKHDEDSFEKTKIATTTGAT